MTKDQNNHSSYLQSVEAIKGETIEAVEGFLKNHPEPNMPSIPQINLDIEASVEGFTDLMQQLNRTMNIRCGIVQHEIDGPATMGRPANERSKITIRDARKSNGIKPEDLQESWMEAIAGHTRGVISLLDMNEAQRFARSPNDEALAKKALVKTFGVYCEKLGSASSPKERKKIVMEFTQELVGILKERGVVVGEQNLANMKDVQVVKIIGDARDFCNLGEKSQNHQVTIVRSPAEAEDWVSASTNKKSIDKNDFVWASMKMNPISKEIKEEYEKVRAYRDNRDSRMHKTPMWFQSLKPHQKELTMKYLDQIMDGEHALPTQLRFLPGLKNAFIDVKGLAENGKISKKAYIECHSGALVHNAGSENSKEAKRITALNMQHAKDVIGKKKTIVLSVLNTNSLLQAGERNICMISRDVAKQVGGVEYHQNGVNIVSLNPDASLKQIEDFSVETNMSSQDKKVLWTGCKSGKDRTFALLMRNAAKIFGDEKQEEFMKNLSESGHAEEMASGAGATRGAYGLKLREMFYRMKDKLLGVIKDRLTNSISGVNGLHPLKLKGEHIYKKMLAEEMSKSSSISALGKAYKSKREPSPEALAKRTALMERKLPVIPSAPHAAPKRAREDSRTI